MRLPQEAIDGILAHWPVARLATLGPQGPEQVPVVFAAARGRLWSPVDGKPKGERELARVRNLRADPACSLLIDHYDDDWARLWWLRLTGRGRVVQPAEPARDRAVADALAALRARYPQYGEVAVLRDPPTLLAIEVTATRSWCAGAAAIPAFDRARGDPAAGRRGD